MEQSVLLVLLLLFRLWLVGQRLLTSHTLAFLKLAIGFLNQSTLSHYDVTLVTVFVTLVTVFVTHVTAFFLETLPYLHCSIVTLASFP